jgi:hypothetical protein
MIRCIRLCGLVVAFCWTVPAAPAFAQPLDGLPSGGAKSWDALSQLAAATPIVVSTEIELALAGRFVMATEEQLEISLSRSGRRVIARDSVRAVRLSPTWGVGRSVLLGVLAGSLAGYAAGSANACNARVCGGERGLAVAGGTLSGATFGAIGGFAFGQAMRTRQGRLVYVRP